jgi:Na+-driven multidrug efflux pump
MTARSLFSVFYNTKNTKYGCEFFSFLKWELRLTSWNEILRFFFEIFLEVFLEFFLEFFFRIFLVCDFFIFFVRENAERSGASREL